MNSCKLSPPQAARACSRDKTSGARHSQLSEFRSLLSKPLAPRNFALEHPSSFRSMSPSAEHTRHVRAHYPQRGFGISSSGTTCVVRIANRISDLPRRSNRRPGFSVSPLLGTILGSAQLPAKFPNASVDNLSEAQLCPLRNQHESNNRKQTGKIMETTRKANIISNSVKDRTGGFGCWE